jgi:hypothetical protein
MIREHSMPEPQGQFKIAKRDRRHAQ